MRSKLILATWLCSGILAVVELTGCTMSQPVVAEESVTKSKPVAGSKLEKLKSERRVKLHMKNGDTIVTKFRGAYPRPASHYSKAYVNWVREGPDRFGYPAFAAEVVVTAVTGGSVTGLFDGVDFDRIYVRVGDESKGIKFSEVLSLSGESNVFVTGDRLAAHVAQEGVPLRRHYWFGDGGTAFQVDPRDIREIFVYKESAGPDVLIWFGLFNFCR